MLGLPFLYLHEWLSLHQSIAYSFWKHYSWYSSKCLLKLCYRMSSHLDHLRLNLFHFSELLSINDLQSNPLYIYSPHCSLKHLHSEYQAMTLIYCCLTLFHSKLERIPFDFQDHHQSPRICQIPFWFKYLVLNDCAEQKKNII